MDVVSRVFRFFFRGHPDGLPTLFFTEFWERFSYYGMRALLVLFMVDQGDGLGFDDADATAIYGLYAASVYLMALPGGWVADRLVGAQQAVWLGGIVITAGHFVLAIPSVYAFFAGLLLVVMGTGLLKPNVSAVVGELYEEGDPRRDGGFTIFYMGINLGAIFGPLICGYLAESEAFGWHWGFAAAGVGMVFGLIQYRAMRPYLGDAGRVPAVTPGRADWGVLWGALGLILLVTLTVMSGFVEVDPRPLAEATAYAISVVAVVYFGYLLIFGGLSPLERNRVLVIIWLFLGAALFWSGFEQAGSSFNLFAERYTDRNLGEFEIPATWFQSLNPVFIVLLAPAFAQLWVWLARRHLEPATPTKFGLGLVGMGLGFAVLIGASVAVVQGQQVGPGWLLTTYLIHTIAELVLSPVGLSATTKLAPRRYVGQMMGIWFLGASLGSVLAGLIAGEFNAENVEQMPTLYRNLVALGVGSGAVFLLLTKPIQRLMGGAR
ncbi:MAG TPA: peptide MFS transporter [Polyangiaceae bacterium LLY-WYZ-14_1]|nr:peptide MFS transporter [Polyangiaceae bacterium LLY-WYZ-14_1]